MPKRARKAAVEPSSTPATAAVRPPQTSTENTSAGDMFQKLVDIMARLRGPGGCPWDREQTIESLRGFVLEETYEVLDAIDRGDHAALRGEIGDLLFEGVFLAQIEADEGGSASPSRCNRSPKSSFAGIRTSSAPGAATSPPRPGAGAVGADQGT